MHITMGKNILKLSMQKSFKIGPKLGKYVKHIKIAKDLLKGGFAAIVSFLKTPEI